LSRGYRTKKHGRRGKIKQDNLGRRVTAYLTDSARKPLTEGEIARGMRLKAGPAGELGRTLEELVRKGRIIRIKGGRYAMPQKIHVLTGTMKITDEGYGLLAAGEEHPAVHIPSALLGGAMDGDTVAVRPEGRGRRGMINGRVIRIVERGRKQVVAVFETGSAVSVARPYGIGFDRPMVIPAGREMEAAEGQLVLVKILEYPTRAHPAIGEVTDLLGEPDSPSAQTMAVVHSHSLPHIFPEDVLREAAELPGEITRQEWTGRQDLRELSFVTIDGVNARDFDDALHASMGQRGVITLQVAIADVSHFVKPGSKLDVEASNRGNSVYFPDMVIPMLPEHLANNLCSLRPEVDRLAMVCQVQVDKNGNAGDHEIFPAVIRSSARLTYRETEDHINEPGSVETISGAVAENVGCLMELFNRLSRKRQQRSSLDFDFPEPEVVLSATGHVENILRSARYTSHRLVEECMLLANAVVARFISEREVPGVYRVHDAPDEDRIMELNLKLAALGHNIPGGQLKDPAPFSRILDDVRGTPKERFLNTVILRSMMRARYATEPEGHFALALADYTHFTSPIRRYADLMVHRILKGLLGLEAPYEPGGMDDTCLHISETEQISEKAQRDLLSFLRALFMEDKVGEEFSGVISGIAPFGIFVELGEYFIEGMVHLSALHDDYYIFREESLSLLGEHTGRLFRIGDEIKVRLLSVELERRYIDFELVENPEG
jgi:ribonuclease R